jgi:hypothetical protein
MAPRIHRLVPALAAIGAVGAGSLLLVVSTSQASPPQTRRHLTAASTCPPAPAACGTNNIDEFVIHALNEAARRALELQTTGTTTANPTP